jgi:adenosine deaminase
VDDLQGMGKADLHVHLSGAIPRETVERLFRENNIPVPDGLNFSDLQIQGACKSILDYFKPWQFLKRLPKGKKCLGEMINGAFASFAQDNIKYVELRHSLLPVSINNNISIQESLEWLTDELESAQHHFSICARLIISISRYNLDLAIARNILDAIKNMNVNGTIVGLDLTGDEDSPLPPGLSRIFKDAKEEVGLSVTIHAGESGNTNNIYWAIDECRATRLGHALAASGRPDLLDKIRESDICIEVCLSSNILSGYVDDIDNHPVSVFLKNNVPFVLCSDNPAINRSSLTHEYGMFLRNFGNRDVLGRMYEQQMKYAFKRE